jgi:hypothetical protein
MAGRTFVDPIDVDNLEEEVILMDQEEEHIEIRNHPCNCRDCVMWALIYGGAKVVGDGDVWAPVLTEDNLIHVVTAADIRKSFSMHKTPEEIASAMAEMKIRAFRKEPPQGRISTGKKTSGKRKAVEDPNPNDPKELFPRTPAQTP